jgi:hypothetical protein
MELCPQHKAGRSGNRLKIAAQQGAFVPPVRFENCNADLGRAKGTKERAKIALGWRPLEMKSHGGGKSST